MHRTFIRITTLVLLGVGTLNTAWAEGMYALGSLGFISSSSTAQSEMDSALTSSGVTGLQSSIGSSTGYKAILGYQVNRNLAIEGGQVDTGNLKYSATAGANWVNADIRGTGFNFSALGIAPINPQLSLFGKLGYTMAVQKASAAGTAGSASTSIDKNSVGFGAGGMYQLTDQLGLRLEWERFYDDVNMVSVGLQIKF